MRSRTVYRDLLFKVERKPADTLREGCGGGSMMDRQWINDA